MKSIIPGPIKALLLAAMLGTIAFGPGQAETTFSKPNLDAFVTAATKVDSLIKQWLPRLQGAGNHKQADELRKQANAELLATIERTEGITLQEYQQIGAAARTNPELSSLIRKLYETKSTN